MLKNFFIFVLLLIICLIFIINYINNESKQITINIYYTSKNGNAKKFADEMEKIGIVDSIRKENGNLKYEYFYSKDDNLILLVDIWKSQKYLDKHHKSPIMDKIIELRNKYDLSMEVQKYVNFSYREKFDKKFIKNQ